MKKYAILLFQAVIVLIGIGALTFLLWEPRFEGRNVHATVHEIYFRDPFLAYSYISSIPFFVVLYQTFRVLKSLRQNKISSQTVKALQTIKYCAIAMIGFVVGGEIWIRLGDSDDRAGGVFMGVLITTGSIIIAALAVVFEKRLQNVLIGNDKLSTIN